MCCSFPVGVQAEEQRAEQRVLRGGGLVLAVAATTTSAVRSCLILSMVRAFCWYVAPSGLATTPSRPAPSNWLNHCSATAGSVVVRVRWQGPSRSGQRRLHRGPALGERPADERLVPEGQQVEGDVRRPASSPPAGRPATRAGWMRSCSDLELQPDSPDQRRRSRRRARTAPAAAPGRPRRPRGSSGSAAWCCGWRARPRRRPGRRCSGTRPTSARSYNPPYFAGSGIPFTDLASIGCTGGITGRSTARTLVGLDAARAGPIRCTTCTGWSEGPGAPPPGGPQLNIDPRLVCRQGPPDFESGLAT